MIWLAIALTVTLAVTAVLAVALVRRSKVTEMGMELLRSEEYNNRLLHSGEPGADRIVRLFNGLMERLSEERLKLVETNHLLDLLVKASPTGIAVMDFDGREITVKNHAFDRVASSVARYYPEGMEAILKGMKNGEERILRFGDMEIYRLSRLSFMERGFRRPFFLTERLTDEIRRAEKDAYGKVVRTISHEVNNTIGGVSSFLESLSDMDELDPDLRALASSCLDSCEGMARFIKGYADVVRIGEPEKVMLDYNGEIRKSIPFLCSILPQGVSLDFEPDPAGLRVAVDPVMMRQVLVNVVKNAGEAISGEGHVVIRTRKRVLEIENDGKPITSEEAQRLFTPFFTTKANGQGLGLTLTCEILHRQGCRFSLSSPDSSHTVFRIEF